jgi:hypothetical protein
MDNFYTVTRQYRNRLLAERDAAQGPPRDDLDALFDDPDKQRDYVTRLNAAIGAVNALLADSDRLY